MGKILRLLFFVVCFEASFVFVSASLGTNRDFGLELKEPFFYEQGSKCTVDSGCLILTPAYENVQGNDVLGNFSKTRINAKTLGGSIIGLITREYDSFTVYEQLFETGILGTSTGNSDGVTSAWPIFRIPNATEAPGLRYVTPGGYMLGWTLYAQGSIEEDIDRFRHGEHGGIVGLIQPDALNHSYSVLMTALTEPMSANVELVRGTELLLQWGVQGMAESIPADYSIQFIVTRDVNSFNKNVLKWGELMRKYHNSFKVSDFTVDHLGYWTDNGAAHYYNPIPFKNFEEVVIDMYQQSVIKKIPFRYLQIDSWWYYKGEGDGVKNWTAKPSIFPNGINYIHTETGWPILAHNRYFSNDTDYAEQNGGDYPFTIDDPTAKALPLDKHFWDDLFDEGKTWGLIVYEQDWLDRQYEYTSALHTNVTLGSWWLNSMGVSAGERDLTIQYCMPFPRHFLHSVSLPSVTQIRVSDDYVLTPNQWRIGHTSLFAHALGLKPYKDNFWSSKVNENIFFVDCEASYPYDADHPFDLRHMYGGRQNVTRNGVPCVPWTNFGYDVKYPHSGMRINLCRNPEDVERGSFCFTKAGFDIPEEEWEWDYCEPPVCDIDCYMFNGVGYLGNYGTTETGLTCTDWRGEFGYNGTMCRNPTKERAPWCYVTEDHTQRDFCNNKCTEVTEPNSALQSAVSTLSTGPVGIGDKAPNLDRDLIMKSCRSDGLILKPSKPLTAIDLAFMYFEYRELWTSQTDVSDLSFGIIFLAEIGFDLTLTAFDLNLETAFSTDVIIFQNYPTELSNIRTITTGGEISIPGCGGYLEFCLYYTSPLLQTASNRYALLGETTKWAPVSSQRIANIDTVSGIQITVVGLQGEIVTLAFWDEQAGTTFTVMCSFVSSDPMTLNVDLKTCN